MIFLPVDAVVSQHFWARSRALSDGGAGGYEVGGNLVRHHTVLMVTGVGLDEIAHPHGVGNEIPLSSAII